MPGEVFEKVGPFHGVGGNALHDPQGNPRVDEPALLVGRGLGLPGREGAHPLSASFLAVFM